MASPAIELGTHIRMARKAKGLTIAQLASEIGRPREWLNRLELGYSEYGEHKPASQSDLRVILQYLDEALDINTDECLELGRAAEEDYRKIHHKYGRSQREPQGRVTQAEVIMGETEIVEAIINLIHTQDADAVIRNTGIRHSDNAMVSTEVWARYGKTLGQFLSDHPRALVKRVEYIGTSDNLAAAKTSDLRLSGSRDINEVHNAKVKFRTRNPLSLHVLIGKGEAILALPQVVGQPGSNMALMIRDKQFVEALRIWFDEILWDGGETSQLLKFSEFDESFRQIAEMYGVEPPKKSD